MLSHPNEMSKLALKKFLPVLAEAICKHFCHPVTRTNLDDTMIKTTVPLCARAFSVTDTTC